MTSASSAMATSPTFASRERGGLGGGQEPSGREVGGFARRFPGSSPARTSCLRLATRPPYPPTPGPAWQPDTPYPSIPPPPACPTYTSLLPHPPPITPAGVAPPAAAAPAPACTPPRGAASSAATRAATAMPRAPACPAAASTGSSTRPASAAPKTATSGEHGCASLPAGGRTEVPVVRRAWGVFFSSNGTGCRLLLCKCRLSA